MRSKYLYIRTFGCQMNVHDSEQLVALLEGEGYEYTEKPEKADLVVINTCCIRAKADQKVYSELGHLRELKCLNPELRIAVGGCLAQQKGKGILIRAPYVDLVFGTHQLANVPELLARIEHDGKPVVDTSLCSKVASLAILHRPPIGALSAYVTIMQGCNNFCSYCVVPYVRGREESRSSQDIVKEVRALVTCGVREITLLGQNVNSYGSTASEDIDFPKLIRKIGHIEGIERIRFTTSHPKDLSDDLMQCFADVDPLCEHIHLPVQSGSNKILALMNRGYTREDYLKRVGRLRDICPDICITSDFIVGFPGETEEDFQESLDLMEKIRFDNLFSFKYSPREGTAALNFPGQVTEDVQGKRLKILQSLQNLHSEEKNKGWENRMEDVLVEGVSRNSLRDLTGRTRGNKIVNFPGEKRLVGKTVCCRITKAYLHSLRGEYLPTEA